MDSQIQNFVAVQREKAAQMLAEYGQRERDRDRRRDRRRDYDDRTDTDDRRERRYDRDRSHDRMRYEDDRNYDRYDRDGGSTQTIDYNHGHSSKVESNDDHGHRSRHMLESRDDRASDKWMTDTPTNTVLLRGLPPNVDEQDIKAELMMFGAPVKDVRLMKRKDTGASRGFAFVEFQNVADSQRWMEQNQGQLTLLNQYTINMFYSTPKTGSNDARPPGDWTCSKCGVHNFKRREQCFKCNISKEESDRSKEGDGYDQVGHNLCNTLILRGLDALTTEENIITAIHKTALVVLKNLRVIRDALTQTSRGYAFVEMGSIGDSSKLMDSISKLHAPFEVDGKAIIVNYAKNTFTTVMAQMNQQWIAGQYAYAADGQVQAYYITAGAAAGLPAGVNYYDYSQYYAQNYQTAEPTAQGNTTNAAAAVAQAAIQQAQAAKAVQKKVQQLSKQQEEAKKMLLPAVPTAATTLPSVQQTQGTDYQYPVPDVSTYQYDDTSGYYYDPATGLYYDAASQYYYNAHTAQFLYWDGDKCTYLPAPSDEQAPTPPENVGGGANNTGHEKDKKDKDKKEKVKVAKKIAKDMEKWAKTLNAQKDAQKDSKKSYIPAAQEQIRKEAAAADAGFAILEKTKQEAVWKSAESSLMPPPPAMPGGRKGSPSSGLVANYGDADESEEESEDITGDQKVDEQFADWSKIACLLCKRQFPNKEGLQRHNQLSDLHKTNLEEYRKKNAPFINSQGSLTAAGKSSVTYELQYRDRAKERRQKYGAPAPPEPKKRAFKAPESFEQPTKQGIGSDNIGNKLMQKMGWNQGEGLGRGKQGIVDPVQASRRTMGAGLGLSGSTVQLEPGDTYKDCVKKTMFARFQEMNNQ